VGRLDGKVAVVTGASRGQGEAEARLFVAEGARVLLADVLDDEGEKVAADLGDAAAFTHLDVTDEAEWSGAVATAEERFGPVSVLVNNAGVLHFEAVHKIEADDFDRVMGINVRGVFLGMKVVTPSMVRAGGGAIVNISSTAGLQGQPFLGAYVASKWAKGIRVNSVHPGGIDTPMIAGSDSEAPFYKRLPVARIGQPSEVAEAVLFLASDEASYVTGAELAVDGGATCGDLGLLS
jgi:3alpha(or 20beta)-hydroxysteroid dehydrogenase